MNGAARAASAAALWMVVSIGVAVGEGRAGSPSTSINDIIAMVRAGQSAPQVIAVLKERSATFALTLEDLQRLRSARVPVAVVRYMLETAKPVSAPGMPSTEQGAPLRSGQPSGKDAAASVAATPGGQVPSDRLIRRGAAGRFTVGMTVKAFEKAARSYKWKVKKKVFEWGDEGTEVVSWDARTAHGRLVVTAYEGLSQHVGMLRITSREFKTADGIGVGSALNPLVTRRRTKACGDWEDSMSGNGLAVHVDLGSDLYGELACRFSKSARVPSFSSIEGEKPPCELYEQGHCEVAAMVLAVPAEMQNRIAAEQDREEVAERKAETAKRAKMLLAQHRSAIVAMIRREMLPIPKKFQCERSERPKGWCRDVWYDLPFRTKRDTDLVRHGGQLKLKIDVAAAVLEETPEAANDLAGLEVRVPLCLTFRVANEDDADCDLPQGCWAHIFTEAPVRKPEGGSWRPWPAMSCSAVWYDKSPGCPTNLAWDRCEVNP